MRVILVGSGLSAMSIFRERMEIIPDIEVLGMFENGWEALHYVTENEVDLVILDAEVKGMNGIYFGKCLREQCPELLMIVIFEKESYAMEVIRLHAVAYLVKPYGKEELVNAVETARVLSKTRKRRVFIKTFGHFDVFVDNKPIMFHSGKAKELLALLVDRQGGTVSTDQVICALWEERPNDEATQNLCSKVSKNLYRELEEYGVQEIFITNRGIRRVDTELFDCDLYELLAGKGQARKQFVGDYMLDYSWAEGRMMQLNKFMLDT